MAKRLKKTDLQRFNAKYIPEPNSGCWLWTAAIDRDGYAVLDTTVGHYAHRYSYTHFKGPIPEGYQIDHLCKTRGCVNPDHLEAVTLTENVNRSSNYIALNRKKTHCPRGHEFTPENTYFNPKGKGFNRACINCRTYFYKGKAEPANDNAFRLAA